MWAGPSRDKAEKMAASSSLWRFSSCLAGLLVLVVDSLYASSDSGGLCSGRFWCAPQPSAASGVTYFYYDVESEECKELTPYSLSGCAPAANSTFSSIKECYTVCGDEKKKVQTCVDTEFGCCRDGVTAREGERGCPDEASPGQPSNGEAGTKWGAVISGVSGAVLLLGLVGVGLSAYTYRRRQRHRNRWYIHEVLQMYDGGESSDSGAASDTSWDDPEHKNLFDRL